MSTLKIYKNEWPFDCKVGHYYWVLGGLYKDGWNLKTFIYQKKTSIFSLQRQIWFDGPDLPEDILMSTSKYCVTSLNQTTAIFIGVGETMKGVILYNFATNIWTQTISTPLEILWCSCSSAQGKDYNQ